jgi:16S rRNA (cytosine967-C5)-methyltransferase
MSSRKLAVDIISQVIDKGAYSNIALANELNKASLNDKDRALVTEIVYGTLKYKYTIDTILKYFIKKGFDTMDNNIIHILRVSIYQMRYLDKVPDYAIVNEAVNLSKKISIGASKLVNGVLRNYIRNKDTLEFASKDYLDEMAIKYSFDKWMIKLFANQYGREITEKILKGLNEVPDITVRVNNINTSFEEAWNRLKELGYDIDEGEVAPEAIKIKKGKNIENNLLFKSGMITVQDESAMLIAPAMDVEENMVVLDLCSAPGGKATHLGELMNNTGTVRAFDIHENKLGLIKDNADRLGLKNIRCEVADASVFNEALKDSGDRVLIDVPCSGLGIIRKKPEIKWNKNAKELKNIASIQRNIICNASKYVKLNGILFYSTCTLNKEENEEVVKWFLENNKNYSLEKLYFGELENIIYHDDGMVTILPNEKMDGFFMAKIRRLK